MATTLTESANDPYKANFHTWETETSVHLKKGASSHRAVANSLEAAREMITQHSASLATALKRGDKAQAGQHQERITKLQGVHDGILSGLSKAGVLPIKAARRKAFNKQHLTESQGLSAPKPVVGIWFGEGSAKDHSAYDQGLKAAQKLGDDFKVEHLKVSALKAHEKHVHSALNGEDKLREMLKVHNEEHPRVQAQSAKVKEHKDLADMFHAFARGLNRYETER